MNRTHDSTGYMDEQDPPGVSQLEASCPFSNLQLDAEKTSPNPVQVADQGFSEDHNLETGRQQMETLNEENAFIEDDDCNQLGGDFSEAFLPAMSRETKVLEHNSNAMVGYRVSEIEDTVIVSGGSRVSEQEGAVIETGETRVSEQDSNVMVAGVIRVSKQEDTLRVSGVLASERTRVVRQEATVVLSSGYRVSQHEANVMVPGAIRVSGPEAIEMEPPGSRVLGQEGVLYLSHPTGGGEHFTVEDISGEDLEEGRVDAFSALEGVEFEYDTEFAAQFDMDTPEEEPVTGAFSGEHCRFSALDADRMASGHASQEVRIVEHSLVQCHVDLNEGVDSKSTQMEPITGTILDSAIVHETDVAPKCVQNEHMQADIESASTDAVQRVEELSGIQGALLQAQTQNKEALADSVQEDKNLAGDQHSESDVENAQGPPDCDDFTKLTDGEDRRASAPEIYLQCASDTDEVFLSLYGEEVEISQTSQSCESRNSHDIASTHQMRGGPMMAVEEVENGSGHLRTTSQAAAVKIFPREQELSRSYPDSGAGLASAPNTTSDKEGMHVHSMPVFRAETDRTHEEEARQTELNIQGSSASGECGLVVIGPEEIQFTDLHSVVVAAAEQTVEAENDVSLNEKGHIDSSGAVHTDNESLNAVVEAGIFECARVPQDENISVGVSKDFSMSTEEPASQFLLQKEEITIIQTEHAVSRMDTDESATEQIEKHINDPMLMVENVVEEFNGIVSEANQLNGGEFLREKPSKPEQGKLLSSEHQEEHSPKKVVNSCPTQAGVAEQGEKPEVLLKNSPSDPGTFVPWQPDSLSLPDDNIQEQHTSEDVSGDKYVDIEKPASYMVVRPKERTDKHSEREEHCVSSTEAFISPTKHSEKQVDDHMFAKAVHMFDGGIVEAKQSDGEKIYEEKVGEWFSSEPEEEHSAKKLQKARKEGHAFGIGDLVWAKVRSHPWWPAQIFDPVHASVSAKKIERSGRALVGFFGDCTYGWLQQSQMIAFRPYFKEKVKQTTMKSFCKAVAEALEEFCRRSELGLNCPHYKGSLYSSSTFPDANAGIQKGVRIINHKDISASVEMLKPDKALEFVKGVACSPFCSWSSTLEVSELRGHAYGLRTCMVASKNSNAGDLLQNIQVERAVSAYVSNKLKRRFSSLETNDEAVAEEGKEAKKVDMGQKRRASEGKGLSLTPRRLKTPVSKENDHTEAVGSVVESDQVARNASESGKGKRDRLSEGFKVSKKVKRDRLSCLEASSDAAVGKEAEGEKSLDDGTETLFALAGYHPKVLNRSGKGSLRDDENSGFIKKKVRRKSAWDAQDAKSISDSERADEVSFKAAAKAHHKRASDSDLAASTITETKTKDAFSFMPSDSDEKSFDADDEVLKGKKKSLNNKKSPVPLLDLKKVQVRTVEGKQQFNSLRLESRDGLNRASKVTKPREAVVVKGEMQSSSDTPKKGDVRKLNKAVKLGDSIRKVAGELTATPPLTKCADEFSAKSMSLGSSKETKGLASEPPSLPKYKKAVCKVSAEERSPFSPVQLRQGLELLARDPLNCKPSGRVTEALFKFRTKVFKKSSGYETDAAPFSGERLRKAVKHTKKGHQAGHAKAEAITSPPCWQIVGHRSQRPGVQELALAARKRKSEIVQEGVAKTSKKSPTSGPHGHHSSKVIISMEKPTEPRLFEKNIIQYSRRPVPPASNVKRYSQIYDEKLSSQLPLGLFMRFPEDFALPSESQLKATFVRFGPLQTSGTRVFKDSTSAQVVFKHGRDAEFALKHAKKNAMFGQAAVTYKLRHFSHSSRADTKKDTPASARDNSSSRVDRRLSISSKERIERHPAVANASSQNRVEHGGTGTSEAMQIPSNDNMATNFGSEPTGDIQDKMMTLLRQVSVIVGTSPVRSDTA